MVAERNGWSMTIPGVPVAADGASFDEATDEMIDALRAYAEDWHLRLRGASNHRDNHGLVQLIDKSDDEQLRDWLATLR
ncbi:type II toxin-antitoxin system HicB family antitoxin [Amycolatopsis thailandensis]|uniref:type II toxin-antitoxin system HicB family antitoxin n=1 Tax=Amycolatopsis thailandensis TaxID=589330 RepID=UPI003636BA2F